MAKKRDTYKYKELDGNKIVNIGITDDPKRREGEHKSEGHKFTKMQIFGSAVSRESAEKWEEQELAKYRKSHGGKNPKYNKTSK